MPSMEDFLDQPVNPPTEQQRIWATENFSSRVMPEIPEVCLTSPVITEDFTMHLRGLEIGTVFAGHGLVDVPFED